MADMDGLLFSNENSFDAARFRNLSELLVRGRLGAGDSKNAVREVSRSLTL